MSITDYENCVNREEKKTYVLIVIASLLLSNYALPLEHFYNSCLPKCIQVFRRYKRSFLAKFFSMKMYRFAAGSIEIASRCLTDFIFKKC